MQNPYARTFERRKLLIDQNATQTLQHVLPNCLPSPKTMATSVSVICEVYFRSLNCTGYLPAIRHLSSA